MGRRYDAGGDPSGTYGDAGGEVVRASLREVRAVGGRVG
ncbi:hypothetical protein B005_1412 [Nocardiopsis alba ATCC BAA-2165]|uniref:Uncharacterized protein n=1 Tax=Nocardiopsis alba (strain ATCC BAA-2165 / BE74) TaxID=1205910 RepID=J7LC84_NOCAA|nr:hypothetical protein B005_1412 [Nocardiopsis alba ATCC BAA-2165]